ncbi:phosphorylase family protein [Sulfurospirillum sp. 1612]|uniref:phosphorylase family protein n=1 Tax=Sulfurospirillum sp. 1612 TaxID=3094835 RepID=UPI002F94E25D
MKILSAGHNELFDIATPVGIGLIQSSITLTQLILEQKPKSLIFIGTAGSYGSCKPFDLLISHTATNIETGFFSNTCYTPIQNKIASIPLNVSCETTNSVSCIINSSNYITTNKPLGIKYENLGIKAENMEFYAILTVAKKFNIPAMGIFVVTNYCDNNAHTDFIKNHEKAKSILIENTKKIVSQYE